jgi:TolB-like protein
MSWAKVNKLAWAVLIISAMMITAACQGTPKKQPPPTWRPQRLAILPFSTVPPDAEGSTTACSPLTGAVFACGVDKAINSEAEAVLEDQLLNILSTRATFEVIPPSMTGPVFQRLRRAEMGRNLAKDVAATGKKLGVDGVLVGHIYRFRQRVGGAASAESPASVAFDLALVRVSDAKVLWKNSFDETQKSLSENLFNIEQYMKTGLRWLTAQELARVGMDQLMMRFPWLKPEKNTANKG